MAINTKDFPNKIDTGLKSNKDGIIYFYSFTDANGSRKRGLIDYSSKSWDKRTRDAKAKAELLKIKSNHNNSVDAGFSEDSSLNEVAELYFRLSCDDTDWNRARRAEYNKYVGDIRTKEEIALYAEQDRIFHEPKFKLGKKKIKDIKTSHIDAVKRGMETTGFSKQNADGCSPRTIKKVLAQVIKPILQYAVDNDALSKVPAITLPKQTAGKKSVTNATETLATLYKTITTYYSADPFYKSLFLFALYGRRLNEILTLEWGDVDFLNNTYTIREENSKTTEQTFELPPVIAEALNHITVDKAGLIFVSPKTNRKLSPPKRQLANIKTESGIDDLTFHKFRHILVSAMAESGIVSSVLSASLGHANSMTTERHYITQNHTKASATANKAIEALIS